MIFKRVGGEFLGVGFWLIFSFFLISFWDRSGIGYRRGGVRYRLRFLRFSVRLIVRLVFLFSWVRLVGVGRGWGGRLSVSILVGGRGYCG